jgi:hypothetical protein
MKTIKLALVAVAIVASLASASKSDAAIISYDVILTAGTGLSGTGNLTVDTAFVPGPNAIVTPGSAVTNLTIDIGTSAFNLTSTFVNLVFQTGNPLSITSQTFTPGFLLTGGSGYIYQLGAEVGSLASVR